LRTSNNKTSGPKSKGPIEENEMEEACSTFGEMRNAYKILVRKPEGKSNLKDLGTDGRIIL
jgi:hypothetical protein